MSSPAELQMLVCRHVRPWWRVLVLPHEDGGGYFVVHRVNGYTQAQGAGLHLRAATLLARDIRDGVPGALA